MQTTRASTTPAEPLPIDVQHGLDEPGHGDRNHPDAGQRIAASPGAGWPMRRVQHMSVEPGSPPRADTRGSAFKREPLPTGGEPVFERTVDDAAKSTTPEAKPRRAAIRSLVVAGVSTAARMADNPGLAVLLVSDAIAAFERTGADGVHHGAEQMHGASPSGLHGEFQRMRSAADVPAMQPAGVAA